MPGEDQATLLGEEALPIIALLIIVAFASTFAVALIVHQYRSLVACLIVWQLFIALTLAPPDGGVWSAWMIFLLGLQDCVVLLTYREVAPVIMGPSTGALLLRWGYMLLPVVIAVIFTVAWSFR